MQLTTQATEKQISFINDRSREVLFSGAIRSGKTFALLYKAIIAASHPKARVGLCRHTLTAFRRTTLKALLEGDGNTPPVLPPNSYTHNETKCEIWLKGGGCIVYFSLEEPDRVRGLTLSSCGVDEATDLSLFDWLLLLGRVNVQIDDAPLQLFGVANPKGSNHWLATRFGIVGNEQKEELKTQGCSSYSISAFENPFLSPQYLEILKTFSGVTYERDVLGKWVSPEGLVFPTFNRKYHISRYEGSYKRCFISIDDGFNDPFVALLVGQKADGSLHVDKEVYVSGLSTDAKIAKTTSLYKATNAERIIIDDAAATLIEDMRQAGLPATKANKGKIFGGLERVRNRLQIDYNAPARLTISPACSNLIREIEQYEYKEGTETPHGSDHALDSLRYAVNIFDRANSSPVVLSKNPKEDIKPAMSKEEIAEQASKQHSEMLERLWNDTTFRRIR